MSKFVLTAQLQLQAPRNTQQVINQLRGQLQGAVNIPVNVQGAVQATKQINQVNQAAQKATTAGERMGKAFGASIKRFAAFNIATRAVGLLASKLSQAVDESIAFQRELIKISQVTGRTVTQLESLTGTITKLSTTLGVSSTSLLQTSRILAQAGIEANDLDVALSALAKTTLAPTFDNITETAEGAVAILAQFGLGVGQLEKQLGAINAVAGQFAVESGDLISAVRRTGGVFRQAGGDLNELLGLFTSVRATTRENAESIATGLRTIFTRIQRPQTIEYLKQFGVQLTDLQGRFVGPFEAVRQLSTALAGLEQGDIRFVQIAEELGGFRQIGKVIPLIQQFEVAERARQAAIEGGNSLTEDAATAQQALAVQIEKTREKFLALIRSISETSTFQIMIKSVLGIANAFIKVAESIKPLLPLIAAFAAVKFTRGIGSFVSGIGAGVRGKNQGGKIHAFASGGFVPGTGNRDTVPAMLTPGEFVIRKSSVNKIGAGTLAAMNENKYNGGGPVSKDILKVGKNSATIQNLIYRDKKRVRKDIGTPFKTEGDEQNQFTVNDTVNTNITKRQIRINPNVLHRMPFGTQKKLLNSKAPSPQGQAFEDYLRESKRITSPAPRFSGNEALDGKKGDELVEVKRTGVDDVKLVDKLLRDQLKHGDKLQNQQLTGGPRGDVINLPPLTELSLNKDSLIGLEAQRANAKRAAFFGGVIRNYANAGKVLPLSPSELNRMKRLNAKGKKATPDEKKIRSALESRFKNAGTAKEKIFDSGKSYGAAYLEKATSPKSGKASVTFPRSKGKEEVKVSYNINHAFLDPADGQKIKKDIVAPKALSAINKTASYLAGIIGESIADSNNIPNLQAITGSIFEAGLARVSKEKLALDADDKRTFDFAGGLGSASKIFGADGAMLRSVKTDAKVASTSSAVDSIREKVKSDLAASRGVLGFARGGSVPSPSDTVPAMLTPGEFVINKKASQSIGYANLNRMNKQGVVGFSKGGPVGVFDSDYISGGRKDKSSILASILQKGGVAAAIWGPAGSGKSTLARSRYGSNLIGSLADVDRYDSFVVLSGSGATKKGSQVGKAATRFSKEAAQSFAAAAKIIAVLPSNLELSNRRRGRIASGVPVGDKRSEKQLRGTKRAPGTDYSLAAELKRFGKPVEVVGGGAKRSKKMARGGPAGTDTVPAMLTPGEFVVNKRAAQSIGYGNLNRMNKQGVVGYAKGGPVQYFAAGSSGTGVKDGGGGDAGFAKLFALQTVAGLAAEQLDKMTKNADGTSSAVGRVGNEFLSMITTISSVLFALQSFGVSLNAQTIGNLFGTGPNGLGQKIASGLSKAKGNFMAGRNFSLGRTMGPVQPGFAAQAGQLLGKGPVLPGSQFLSRAGGAIAQSGVGQFAGRGFGKIATNLKSAAGPALLLGLAFKGVTSAIDAYADHQGKLNKAIEEGNAAQAEQSAANKAGADAANNIGLGLIAASAALGPWGLVAGVTGAAAIKLGESLGIIEPDSLVKFMAVFGGDTLDSIKANAKASALAGKYNKDLAKNSKAASEVMKDVESGAISLAEAFASGALTANLKNAQEAEKAAREASDANEANKTTGFWSAIGRDVSRGFGLWGETTGARNKRINEENNKRNKEAKARTQKEFEALQPQANRLLGEKITQSGGTATFDEAFALLPQELREQFEKLGTNQLRKAFDNQKKAIQENIKFLKSLNFGLREVNAQATYTSASLERLVASQETGFNAFEQSLGVLEMSMTSAAVKLTPQEIQTSQKALADTLKAYGANANQIKEATGAMDGFYKAQLVAGDSLKDLKNNLKVGTNPQALKEEFTKNLKQNLKLQGVDDTVISRISDSLGNLKFDETMQKQIAAGDFSGVLSALEPLGKEIQEQVLGPLRERSKQEGILINLTKQRIQLEQQANEAKKKAIDIELEAAQAIEDFGGRQLTAADKISFVNRKLDVDLKAAGVRGVGSGSANELAAVQQNILADFNSLQTEANNEAQRGTGAFGGVGGAEKDKRPQLEAAQQALIEATRQRISLIKEELEIVKRKNELEKQSLDKLLSGDIEGFFADQAATGAASALRTGNQALIGSFSASAIGAGLKDLQGQNLAPQQMERIASGAFRSLGIQDRRSAQIFAGNTAEEQSRRQEGQQLAGILGAAGAGAAQIAEMAVDAQTVVINAARAEMGNAANVPQPQFKATGGMIYANRGMFVPRGTDTVPAMLTPGEFVVNRAAVQRGNNLAILQAMNNGQQASGPAMSRGGTVRYYRDGGDVSGGGMGISMEVANKMAGSLNGFVTAVDKLGQMQLSVKLDTTNVNVNFNGTSFLANLSENIKTEVLNEVRRQIPNIQHSGTGGHQLGGGSVMGS